MAVLYLVRDRSERLRPLALTAALFVATGCQERRDPSLEPDALLQAELGLTVADRVHRVRITGGGGEAADPPVVSIEPGAYVEFVSADWLLHEVLFEADSLSEAQRGFLERTDQIASPPLIERGSRYVLTFAGAPVGRYVYTLEGNGRSGRGVIVVAPPPERR